MSKAFFLIGTALVAIAVSPAAAQNVSPSTFKDPPPVYRPITSMGSDGPDAGFEEDVRKALLEDEAGSIMFSPTSAPGREQSSVDPAAITFDPVTKQVKVTAFGRPIALQESYPDTASPWLMKALPGEAGVGTFIVLPTPPAAGAAPAPIALPPEAKKPELGFMTPAYFDMIGRVLKLAKEHGRFATYYDEVGYPSGGGNHTVPEKYVRKLLARDERTVGSKQLLSAALPTDGQTVALIATNVRNHERIDLMPLVKDGRIEWLAPMGDWRVQGFSIKTSRGTKVGVDYLGSADPMDPEAVDWFIETSYAKMGANLKPYLGNTINMTFFDDVGIFNDEKMWNPAIAKRFEEITGKPAALYYPALWEDIGPDTAAARVGFFRARSELVGEFPKRVTEWTSKHGIASSGHAPGQYDIQPTDMNGDPFKFYSHQAIPMVDVIFGHGFGREGFKLVSSVSEARDLPITAAETFSADGSIMGYRRLIELYTRGITRFITSPANRAGSVARGTQAEFNLWSGRTSLMLQGGRHVSDIAIVFPIESLQAFYSFDAKDNAWPLPWGSHVYKDADYQAVGAMLTDELHRDFTFVHPEALGSSKLNVEGSTLVMNNKVNRERYKVVVLPGGEVLSVGALTKIKAFYDAGGTVIATSLLPSRSAEFGQDAEIQKLVFDIFGINPAQAMPDGVSTPRTNGRGGKAVFIRKPDAATLGNTLAALGVSADVSFKDNPAPRSGNGIFGYIHRQKGGQEIYFFGNSSDTPIRTVATLRGHIAKPQLWNPHTGAISPAVNVTYGKSGGEATTSVDLSVDALSSVFIVGKAQR